MSETNTFPVRVKHAIKGNYHSCMRRSLQSIALYEADRCLTTRYPHLRPFQRKYALLATAVDLLKTLDFLNDYHRQEIMFRTNASKEPLAPDLAWRRMKLISREINQTILPKAKELIENDENSGKSHDEICSMLLQIMYEESTENSKKHSPLWEYNHNNVFTVYRMYYRGVVVDPSIFPAIPPKIVEVPARKPGNDHQASNNVASGGVGASSPRPFSGVVSDDNKISLAKMTIDSGKGRNNFAMPDGERRALLKEVKDHTELLKEFEGVIPDEELVKRKRALYAALPPVPPPAGLGKKQRKNKFQVVAAVAATADVAIPLATKSTATAMEEEDWEKLSADVKEEPNKDIATVQV